MGVNSETNSLVVNKQVVREFFEYLNQHGLAAALGTFPEDCRWWNAAGVVSRDQMRAFVQALVSHLAEELVFEIDTVTAEEDRVAVEARARGLRKNGVRYANTYHFLFRVRSGRIVEVREHCDTAHAAAVWGDLS
jgi:ketosteroid isomerase-like protein